MHIEHVAIWTHNLEALRTFYARYFGAHAGPRYENRAKQFQSYFLTFESGARLEIMYRPRLQRVVADPLEPRIGLAHLAFVVGDEVAVDALTRRLLTDGFVVVDGPRRTGDGYYESVVEDPDGNRFELTAARTL